MSAESISSKKGGKAVLKGKTEGQKLNSTYLSNVLNLGQLQLLEASHEYWSDPCVTQEQRKKYLDDLNSFYITLLDEFMDTADECAKKTIYLEKVNRKWRWVVIIGTGIVAILNILAANFVTGDRGGMDTAAIIFSVTAAVAAAVLTVLANLENFAGAQRKAQGFRQARERFLDAYREFLQLWNTYVNPFYPRAEACINSMILVRKLVDKDKELRERLVELTKQPKGQET